VLLAEKPDQIPYDVNDLLRLHNLGEQANYENFATPKILKDLKAQLIKNSARSLRNQQSERKHKP
jgi:hypothetical protein